ncbi:MAG TPA: hypothetical protein VJU77_09185 [Chthoniobacterales bacterium]|nr:hypothetical protein [Chthoniobacterales bacterium]
METRQGKITPLENPRRSEERGWWLFCLAIFLIKFILLAADPSPKMFMGDSGSYIWTALTGWIPDDRSYFYGYVIRLTAVVTESLTPLLLFQVCLGAAASIIVSVICRSIFRLPAVYSYGFGVVCAIDPLHLVWEHYILAETISIFLYALLLERSFRYLRDRKILDLAIIQLVGVILIGFRMSYLLAVQMTAIVLPLLAFWPDAVALVRQKLRGVSPQWRVARTGAIHVFVSILVMLVLHTGYKRANGRLSEREPAYLYATGLHLLCAWAPILTPADASDPRMAELIARGDEFALKDLLRRGHQRFADGFLVDLFSKMEPNPAIQESVAKQTALNALFHRPQDILWLSFKTFAGYWDVEGIKHFATTDLGHVDLPPEEVDLLAKNFHWSTPAAITESKTLLQNYFLGAWPYYFVALLAPVWCALSAFFFRGRVSYSLLLLFHSGLLFTTTVALSEQPSIRYLQPLSLLTVLCAALCLSSVLGKLSQREIGVPEKA